MNPFEPYRFDPWPLYVWKFWKDMKDAGMPSQGKSKAHKVAKREAARNSRKQKQARKRRNKGGQG